MMAHIGWVSGAARNRDRRPLAKASPPMDGPPASIADFAEFTRITGPAFHDGGERSREIHAREMAAFFRFPRLGHE